jgi:hypothetical protein
MEDSTTILPLICVEGAVDMILGRPRSQNPYCRDHARECWSSWDLGWHEASELLEMRGQEEASRWLREAA